MGVDRQPAEPGGLWAFRTVDRKSSLISVSRPIAKPSFSNLSKHFASSGEFAETQTPGPHPQRSCFRRSERVLTIFTSGHYPGAANAGPGSTRCHPLPQNMPFCRMGQTSI